MAQLRKEKGETRRSSKVFPIIWLTLYLKFYAQDINKFVLFDFESYFLMSIVKP